MKYQSPLLKSLLALIALTLPVRNSFADAVAEQPYPQIHLRKNTTTTPAQRIYVAHIDLADPKVDIRVSRGGPDPDGGEKYQTTLEVPSVIAEREHFELVVNGDFFFTKPTTNPDGSQMGYVAGKWAGARGPAATDGFLWSPAEQARPGIIFDAAKRPRIEAIKELPADALQIIAGSDIIVKDGRNCAPDTVGFTRTRHPRTAVGFTRDGKTLILAVVDGRQTDAVGMSLTELSQVMLDHGCWDALNLDGGGSTEMVVRDSTTGRLQIINKPSGGRERAVANVLGVSVRGVRRTPTPSPTAPETKH